MMKILAIEHEQPNATAEAFQRLAQAEARRAWELHQAGLIRELYFRTDRAEAVLVLECASVPDAAAILATLPLVEERFIAFELIPLQAYPGFGRLFREASQDMDSDQPAHRLQSRLAPEV